MSNENRRTTVAALHHPAHKAQVLAPRASRLGLDAMNPHGGRVRDVPPRSLPTAKYIKFEPCFRQQA